MTNSANGPIIFTYYSQSELSRSSIQYYAQSELSRSSLQYVIFIILVTYISLYTSSTPFLRHLCSKLNQLVVTDRISKPSTLPWIYFVLSSSHDWLCPVWYWVCIWSKRIFLHHQLTSPNFSVPDMEGCVEKSVLTYVLLFGRETDGLYTFFNRTGKLLIDVLFRFRKHTTELVKPIPPSIFKR